jgi:hypothetical protein
MGGTLKSTVLDPLEDAYEVIELPSQIAMVGFEEIRNRLMRTILVEPKLFENPTTMFLASRGTGIGLFAVTYDGSRAFRDVLLGGVDLIEEVWEWKATAEAMPGDNNALAELVDQVTVSFASRVAELFVIYEESKGNVNKDVLIESVGEWSTDWFPAFDCSVHESTTNVLYLLRELYGQYFGSFKLLLQQGDAAAGEESSLEAVERYTAVCIEATVTDLETIADAAQAIQAAESGPADDGKGFFTKKRSKATRCDPAIFLINNLTFLLDHLRKDSSVFQARTINDPNFSPEVDSEALTAEDSMTGRRAAVRAIPQVPLVANIIEQLADNIQARVEEYRAGWEALFPALFDDPVLESIQDLDTDAPLSKTQRFAVKLWHGAVDRELKRRIAEGCVHVVLDTPRRAELIGIACDVARDKLEDMARLLDGREWSTRPAKWMQRTVEDWVSEIEKMY